MLTLLLAELPFPGWDPVAFRIGPVAVRWYGLGYLAGFMVAGWILDRLGRSGFLPLDKRTITDLIGWLVGGVLIGSRLGYALFYDQALLVNPLRLVQIWRGGLSFHGGLAGVVVATAIFARRRRIAWPRLADSLSLCVPFGIFFVRCANFVNGELYGRLAPGLPWGVRFPTDPMARQLSPDLAVAGPLGWYEPYAWLRDRAEWALIEARIPLRHPSQLYEAALEGLLIAAVLWLLFRRRGAARPAGSYAALFLLLYASARFVVEFTRQPDAQLGFVLGPLSMGQVLSLVVAAAGAGFFWWAQRHSGTLSATPPEKPL